jgi:salicylate hydroxylase
MHRQLLIAGAGIGGLAASIAAARAGWQVRVFERAPVFAEVGAGIQLGPNVMQVLQAWGLGPAVEAVAAAPRSLRVRDARSGRELARMPLAPDMEHRYGAPYRTVHRADLHGLLLDAARAGGDVSLQPDERVLSFADEAAASGAVRLRTTTDREVEGEALIGADGIWSRVRELLLGDGPASPSGHLAYRAVIRQADLPAGLRSQDVTAWLGPRLHAVSYPLRAGELLNLVVFIEGQVEGDTEGWDHAAVAADLQAGIGDVCAPLRELVAQQAAWRLWVICDREPLAAAAQMARGRVALLGDAAHPMRPYVAQGAGMAIEDAKVLAQCLALVPEIDVPQALSRYAATRWARAARVQARSRRNGRIFHLQGPMRAARDVSLALLGARLMDMPWLYGARV